jgi:hypothetical protein
MAEVEENDNGVSMALKENGAAMESKEEGIIYKFKINSAVRKLDKHVLNIKLLSIQVYLAENWWIVYALS